MTVDDSSAFDTVQSDSVATVATLDLKAGKVSLKSNFKRKLMRLNAKSRMTDEIGK